MTRRTECLGLAAITAVAAAVRCIGLESVPPGLTLDEGRLGLLAQAVLRGEDPRPWLHSIETPAWIPTAILFSFLRDTAGVLRLVPALYGTLTIPALWWAVRPVAGAEISLASASALAVLRWHVALTRIAVSPYLMVLAAILSAGFLFRAIADPARGRSALWSGLIAGIGMHLYAGARVLPLVIGAGLLAHPDRRRVAGSWLAGLLIGFALGGWYLLWHPEWFLARIGEVGGEVASPARAARGFVRGLGALNVGGSDIMHTFPAPGGSALLGPVAGLLWIPGILLAWRGSERPVRWLLAVWLAAGFIAGAFGGPHGMRQFLLAPVAAIGAGAAAIFLLRRVPDRGRAAVAVLLIAGHAGAELWRYGLGRHGGLDPRSVEWVYRGHEVAMAARLRAEAARRPVYWSPAAAAPVGTPLERYAAPTIFLSTPPVRRMAPADPAVLAAEGGMIVFPMVSLLHLALLREVYPGGEIWEGTSADPRKLVVYAAAAGSIRRAKLPPAGSPELFRGLWSAEDEIERGRREAAIERCAALAERWPGIGGIATVAAGAYLGLGRFAEAEAVARQAIRTGAVGGMAWLYHGGALLELRRYIEAASAFEVAIRELPEAEDAWLGRVAALANDGRRAEAREVLQEARRRFPGSPRAAGLAAQLN